MGDPMKEGIKLGPLALSRARKNLHRQVLDAVKAGARILTGGEIPAGPAISTADCACGAAPRGGDSQGRILWSRGYDFPFQDRGRGDSPRQYH